MNFTRINKSKTSYSIELSDQQFSFSNKYDVHSSQKSMNEFTELSVARDRFITFTTGLSTHKNKQIRQDIILHCENNSKKQKPLESFLNYQIVLNLINQRIQKMLKNKRIKKNWSDEDVQILIWIISKYSDSQGINDVEKDLHHEDWAIISSLIPGVTPQSCMFKWLSLKKINLATNNWSEEQSALLTSIVNEQSLSKSSKKDAKDWKIISQKLYFSSTKADKIFRNAKQCRQHWNCYLNPHLKKGPWKFEEDVLLLTSIRKNNGSKRWSQIVRHFDGRTQNALKNRYTLIVQKQKKLCKNKTQLEIIQQYLEKCYINQFTGQMNNNNSSDESSNSPLSLQFNNKILKHERESEHLEIKGKINQTHQGLSPIKIKPISFQSMIQLNRQQLQFMQPGKLLNGVFQKTQDFDQSQFGSFNNSNFCLKKYKSSKF